LIERFDWKKQESSLAGEIPMVNCIALSNHPPPVLAAQAGSVRKDVSRRWNLHAFPVQHIGQRGSGAACRRGLIKSYLARSTGKQTAILFQSHS
jgi:hypothetical protein